MIMKKPDKQSRLRARARAFTRVELMVLIALTGMFAAMLLTSTANTKAQAHLAVCIDNQRQLALGWRLYAEDHLDLILGMGDDLSDWRVRPDNIPFGYWPRATGAIEAAINYDEAGYKLGGHYPYSRTAKIIHCPADPRINSSNAPAWVSYSGMGDLGGFVKTTSLLNPSQRFLWTEENDPRHVNAGPWSQYQLGENLGSWVFQAPPTPPDWQGLTWWDAPATFHLDNSVFSYADGHVGVRQWLDDATLAIAAYSPHGPQTDKITLARLISATSSPTGGPLYTDGLGSRHDLPFMAAGYASLQNP